MPRAINRSSHLLLGGFLDTSFLRLQAFGLRRSRLISLLLQARSHREWDSTIDLCITTYPYNMTKSNRASIYKMKNIKQYLENDTFPTLRPCPTFPRFARFRRKGILARTTLLQMRQLSIAVLAKLSRQLNQMIGTKIIQKSSVAYTRNDAATTTYLYIITQR